MGVGVVSTGADARGGAVQLCGAGRLDKSETAYGVRVSGRRTCCRDRSASWTRAANRPVVGRLVPVVGRGMNGGHRRQVLDALVLGAADHTGAGIDFVPYLGNNES